MDNSLSTRWTVKLHNVIVEVNYISIAHLHRWNHRRRLKRHFGTYQGTEHFLVVCREVKGGLHAATEHQLVGSGGQFDELGRIADRMDYIHKMIRGFCIRVRWEEVDGRQAFV